MQPEQEEEIDMREAIIATIPDLEERRTQARARLLEILREADRPDLVAQAALAYQNHDPETFRESENVRLPSHLEYLALQAAGIGLAADTPVDATPAEQAHQTDEAVHLVQEIFSASQMLLVLGFGREGYGIEGEPSTLDEFQVGARFHSMTVRGSGYVEHLDRVAFGCFDPIDGDCRRVMGFTAREAIQLVEAIEELWTARIHERTEDFREMAQGLRKEVKRARRKGHTTTDGSPVEMLASLSPTQAKQAVAGVHLTATFSDAFATASVSPQELADVTGIDEEAVAAFLRSFTFNESNYREQHHDYPYGSQPPTLTPFYEVDGRFLIPALGTFRDALRPRVEDLLKAEQDVWERYLDLRSRFVETESTRILAGMLPSSQSWTRLAWRSDATQGELDGLVACDDVALRIQAKSGRISPSARRGSRERIARDLKAQIGNASVQHQALTRALVDSSCESLGIEQRACAALALPIQIEVIVTLDDITPWSAEHHKMMDALSLDTGSSMSWIISLMDLMVIGDLMSGTEFLDFLFRRFKLEAFESVLALDEINLLGRYISDGLHLEPYLDSDEAHDIVALGNYTEDITRWYFARSREIERDIPKPRQPLPPNLRNLIDRLQNARPPHWLMGSVCLLIGDDESRERLDDTYLRLASNPESTVVDTTLAIKGLCGITLAVDHTKPVERMGLTGHKYAKDKMEEHGYSLWVVIMEGMGGELRVQIIPKGDVGVLAERLQIPSSER